MQENTDDVLSTYMNLLSEIEKAKEKRIEAFQRLGDFTLYKLKPGETSKDIPPFDRRAYQNAIARWEETETTLSDLIDRANLLAPKLDPKLSIKYEKLDPTEF